MQRRFITFNLAIIVAITCFLSGCSTTNPFKPTPTIVPPTVEPTSIATETKTPEPTATFTPFPTLTPTAIPTLAFYSIDPTIVATSVSCKAGLPDEICVSGLYISLTGKKLSKYEVVVSWPGFSGTSFTCPQQALLVDFGENMAPVICDSTQITFITVGLTEITITITWEGGSTTQTIRPTFEVSSPQGPGCEPQCSIGKAEMNIP
jgi:hypothetical protein